MTTNLYIIRHGEAICNVEQLAHGAKTCQGLTERGHAQVGQLAERLARGEIRADVLYASPIARARETAEPIAAALKLPIRWEDDLHEKRPGEEIEGLTWQEVEERFGPYMHDQPYANRVPGGESWATFVARAGTALDEIARRHAGQNVVVVAHGGIVEASFHLFLNLGARTPAGFWLNNTAITQWRRIEHPRDQRWYLVRFNDVAHLAGTDLLPNDRG